MHQFADVALATTAGTTTYKPQMTQEGSTPSERWALKDGILANAAKIKTLGRKGNGNSPTYKLSIALLVPKLQTAVVDGVSISRLHSMQTARVEFSLHQETTEADRLEVFEQFQALIANAQMKDFIVNVAYES